MLTENQILETIHRLERLDHQKVADSRDDVDADAKEYKGEKNYSGHFSTDRTQLTEVALHLPMQQVEDDLANDLICEATASHKPAVTINISGSTFNDIHGDQNIHNYDNFSGNNSVRVDASARL